MITLESLGFIIVQIAVVLFSSVATREIFNKVGCPHKDKENKMGFTIFIYSLIVTFIRNYNMELTNIAFVLAVLNAIVLAFIVDSVYSNLRRK